MAPPVKYPVIPGQAFGRLTVIREDEIWRRRRQKGRSVTARVRAALVQCSCGSAPRTVPVIALIDGTSRSCGCYRSEYRRAVNAGRPVPPVVPPAER